MLAATATPMPGYQPYQVGAGYVDAFAATTVAKKTRSTGTCTTRSGKQLRTLITSETCDGSVGVGVADAGAAYHDVHPFQVGAKALRVTVTIQWTTPQDLDLQVFDPSGAGDIVGEPAGRHHRDRDEARRRLLGIAARRNMEEAVGYLSVAESYRGTVEVVVSNAAKDPPRRSSNIQRTGRRTGSRSTSWSSIAFSTAPAPRT